MLPHRTGFIVLLTLATIDAAGCASPRQDAPVAHEPAPPAPAASSTPIAPPGPGEWTTWTHEQKLAYMRTTFIDEERKIFASWEPVRFRNLECRTCHGIGAVNGTFAMPNKDLAHLIPGKEGYQELLTHEPELFTFMQKKLVPETARLLGLPAFDMEKHTGFSCYQCHVRQED
jgi:hypothetical protein